MRFFVTIVFLFFGFLAFGQINTDRPTQSASVFVLPKGAFQVEAGFLSERPVSRVDVYNVQYVNALLRFGLFDGVELRLTQNYLGDRSAGTGINGLSPTTVGAKIHVLEENEGLPQISVIGQITLTNGDPEFQPPNITQELRLNFQNTITDQFTLGYNLGKIWDGSGNTLVLYSVVLGISITTSLTFFVEPYGLLEKNSPHDGRFNAGLVYLFSDNFQADISVGNGLTKRAPDSFVSSGISVMF